MEIRHLYYFIMTAKYGSFTKAAETLFISQSALSQSIKRLETELEVELFRREGNAIRLTRAGLVFLPEASKIYEQTVILRDRMKELKNEEPDVLNFGISTFYSRYFLPNLALHLDINYPGLSVNFVEDTSMKMEDMVMNGILDCCLVPLPIGHSGLDTVPVRMESIWIALPHDHILADTPPKEPLSLSRLKGDRFILTKPVHRFTALAHLLCENAGFSPHIVYETMNWETVDALVAQGIGVGFVPDIFTSKTGVCHPIYRKIDDIHATRYYVLARRSGRLFSEQAERFLSDIPMFICRGLSTESVV